MSGFSWGTALTIAVGIAGGLLLGGLIARVA